MKRQPITEQKRLLAGEPQRDAIIRLIQNLPLDADKPIEIVIRERQKARSMDANARLWAGPLRDIAEQAFVAGRQHEAKIWNEHFKELYLPEDGTPEADPANGHVKDGYRKWVISIKGERRLVGSTTELTSRGFSNYVHQVEAFGASLGVQYSASPNEMKGMP